jgi:hypothetical protein
MKVLVTGSSGHLGEALVRTLNTTDHDVIGVDSVPSDFTNMVGSIVDRDHVQRCMKGVDAVLHTATLHKPHVFTHSHQNFVDTNITGGKEEEVYVRELFHRLYGAHLRKIPESEQEGVRSPDYELLEAGERVAVLEVKRLIRTPRTPEN